jgi:hypothetical protein
MAGTTNYLGITYPTNTDFVKDGATAMQTIATGFDSAVAIPTYNNQTGTTYTFVLVDAAKVVSSNNAAAVTFTIPAQADVVWTTGATLTVANYGAGSVTIAGAAGVTVTNSGATIAQFGSASIIRTASNAWTVIPFAGGAALLSDGAISGTTGSPTTTTYTDGGINYKAYAFTGSGSITLSKGGLVDMLLVGGGGGGANPNQGSGAGAGAVVELSQVYLSAGTATVTIGGGGAVGGPRGAHGIASTIESYYSAGGAPGIRDGNNGLYGGSGSGAGGSSATGFTGGASTQTFGNAGGNNFAQPGVAPAGGGGGAGAVGVNATSSQGGNGGAGRANSITGTSVTYGGGGGGGTESGTGGTGGTGGGGNGGVAGVGGSAGTANTGGGGGGYSTAGAGGSGLVVVRVLA